MAQNGTGGDAAAPTMVDYSQLMVTMAHTMAMQSAIGSVPPFDGTNLSLKDFIQDVRNAATLPRNNSPVSPRRF